MHETLNDLAGNARTAAVELLQARLFDAIDLTTQTKQAHWNVKGPNFIALHGLFDRIHGEMEDHVDTIAERLVALGGQARGTARSAAAGSTLAEYPLEITAGADHVTALASSLAAFGASARKAIDEAADIGDQDTADVFTGVSRAIDKALWFVEAHKT